MRRLLLLVLGFGVLATPFAAAAQTPEERRQMEWAVERGRLIFALDRAAWVATDDLREHMPAEQQRDVRGYIVDRDAQGLVAIFYARDRDRLVAAYRGRIGPNGVSSRQIFPSGQRSALTPVQQRLARSRLGPGIYREIYHFGIPRLERTPCS